MIDPRRVATLGIGYGALAVATLGLLGEGGAGTVPPGPTIQVVSGTRGGKRRPLSGREEARRLALRREEEELLLTLH